MARPRQYRNTARHIVVEGPGAFPIDMLRYDACSPRSEPDSGAIAHRSERREVHLNAWGMHITPARWESFGWTVKGEFIDHALVRVLS